MPEVDRTPKKNEQGRIITQSVTFPGEWTRSKVSKWLEDQAFITSTLEGGKDNRWRARQFNPEDFVPKGVEGKDFAIFTVPESGGVQLVRGKAKGKRADGTTVFRADTFHLDTSKIKRTPSGGLKIPTRLARTGIQLYEGPDGRIIREHRDADEVFSPESMASFRGAPVTDLHPTSDDGVTPKNFSNLARGHIGDDVHRDGDFLTSTIYINDVTLIDGVLSGQRSELSGGYGVQIDATPGVTADGQQFDRSQFNIRGNHVGIGPPGWGRAGSEVSLRLDARGNQLRGEAEGSAIATPRKEKRKMPTQTITIDGIPFSVEADDAFVAAFKRRDAAVTTQASELETLKGRLDQTEKERDKLKKELDEEKDPKKIGEKVADRAALVEKASKLKTDLKTDGLTDREVMLDALNDAELKADGITDDFIAGAFNAAVKSSSSKTNNDRADGLGAVLRTIDKNRRTDAGVTDGDSVELTLDQKEAASIKRRRDAWKAPLAVSNQRRA